MNRIKNISSAVCYASGVAGLTLASDLADIMGLIVTIISAVSMTVCLVMNIITWFKKAGEDGKFTDEEISELKKELEKYKEEANGLRESEKSSQSEKGKD